MKANWKEKTLADGTILLISYSTPVAMFSPRLPAQVAVTDKWYSRTTSKHIGQFRNRHGRGGEVVMPQATFDKAYNQ